MSRRERPAEGPGPGEVLERFSQEWLAVPGVVGTGMGTRGEEPCLKVFVVERTPEVEARIPRTAGGYPVKVEITGQARARN